MIFKPIFTFHPEKKKLIISVKENSNKNISLDCDASEDDIKSIKSEIASLTIREKHCILFLTFAVLSKQACLIKGETASGKSHIIRIFAKMLGKKLNVYQMNSETSVSILTGQSVLSNHLSKEDVDDINSALTELERIPEISDYIARNITNKHPNEWTRNIFSKLLEYLSSFDFSKYPENEESIESSKQKIIETIQPAKRFHVEKSSFIRTLTEGEWVLFDGIESAPSEIIEKISPLCGENPQLNLLECGEGYYFTVDYLPGSKKINKNFHLFFTYNPTSQVENKVLDPDFADNCASFTLPSIDSTPENTAQKIDPSISCFDELSGPHSFQTLQTILSSLVTLDISCFDLIVA